MKKDFLIFGAIVFISAMVVYWYTHPVIRSAEVIDVVPQEQVQESAIANMEVKVESLDALYIPEPIDLRPVPIQYGGFKKHVSPDGKYIAHSYSDEQGGSGVYISNGAGETLTKTYCGSFQKWNTTSEKITAFINSSCTNKNDPMYLNLYTDGKVELTEDYEEIFSAERDTDMFPVSGTAYHFDVTVMGSMAEHYYALKVNERYSPNGNFDKIIVVKSEEKLQNNKGCRVYIKYDSNLNLYVLTKVTMCTIND